MNQLYTLQKPFRLANQKGGQTAQPFGSFTTMRQRTIASYKITYPSQSKYKINNQQAYVYVWQHGRLRKQTRLGAETLRLKTATSLRMQGCHRKYEALLIFKVPESSGGQN
jgi:hypothetical protein